jgi:hypothetical protein
MDFGRIYRVFGRRLPNKEQKLIETEIMINFYVAKGMGK